MRLADAEAGRLSWHDVFVVCRFVPDGSPLAVALAKAAPAASDGPKWEPRSQDQTLLVILINTVSHLSWMVANYGRKSPTPRKPPRIELPGDQPEETRETIRARGMSRADADVWLAARRSAGRM